MRNLDRNSSYCITFGGEGNSDLRASMCKLVILSFLVVRIPVKIVLFDGSGCEGAHLSLFFPISSPMISGETKQVLV